MIKQCAKPIVLMLIVLVVLAGIAYAETTTDALVKLGNMPERGLIIPVTEDDVSELGMRLSYMMGWLADLPVPAVNIDFVDEEGMQNALSAFTQEDMNNPDKYTEILTAIDPYEYNIYTILLLEKEYYDAKIAAGISVETLLGVNSLDYFGENDGYVYVGVNGYEAALMRVETDEQKALVEKAIARCKELVANLSFQPIVFADGEFTEVPESALVFSTQDLNGNVVTQELFMGKTLTVLNVWGTYCNPCIDEMPELAEWSKSMPEGVQLVGLVCDMNSYDDAEIRELAQMICEATGAEVYTHLVANADFNELLSGVVGVPTTFFIDGNGMFVGSPVVGANVSACKAFVDFYMAE